MRYLITGGAGSFGQAFTRALLADGRTDVVRIYSRDEAKHARFAEDLTERERKQVRFIIGDVTNYAKMVDACWGVDVIVHAAAMKRVEVAAYNPFAAVDVNVDGTANVIRAGIERGVGKIVVLSSDKACAPVTPYGLTKAVAEFLAVQGNAQSFPRGTKIAAVRYGNVLGSRGAVVHLWRRQIAQADPMTITDPACTRFWLTMAEAVWAVSTTLDIMAGGEVFIPPARSMALLDLAEALSEGWPVQIVGMRAGGEKTHEVLVSRDEAARAYVLSNGLMMLRPAHQTWTWPEGTHRDARPLGPEFSYTSDVPAAKWGLDEMRALLNDLPEEVA